MRELSVLQAAYWVGRTSDGRLGGVSAHICAEFDGRDLDPARLREAIRAVCRLHPMLMLRIDRDGRPLLDDAAQPLRLEVYDLRRLSHDAREAQLQDRRSACTSRQLDLSKGRAAAFELSLLSGEGCRLHVDMDMIAVDPNSFRIVMRDLARVYEDPRCDFGAAPSGYFAWQDALGADEARAQRRERDRIWWSGRLREIAPAPRLPPPATPRRGPHSDRLAAWLPAQVRSALATRARHLRITSSSLLLGLFAVALGRAMHMERFRLNVPTFWREPVVPRVDRIVGEFSNVLILSVDLSSAETLGAFCRAICAQLMELLGHAAYPGVSVMRDLSRLCGTVETAPVVFTAGIDLEDGDLFDDRVTRVLGRMNWVTSQGPHVALDAQVAASEGGVLINFDVRFDALSEPWTRNLFETYVALLDEVARDPARLEDPLAEAAEAPVLGSTEAMLIALQRRLAPNRPCGVDTPFAGASRSALRDFLAAYLPNCRTAWDPIGVQASPRDLARRIRAVDGGRSDEIARIFLETVNEG